MFLRALLSFLLICGLLAGHASAAGRTVRLLTIGNSFSANATRHLDGLVKAGGHTLIHDPLVIGGASFQVHADKARRHEADPQNPAGLYKNGRGLRENLAAEPWDYVTIQQASIQSHDYATYQPHAGWLRDFIGKHAPGAKLLVHETWPYRKDDPRFTKPSGKPGEPVTQEEMYRGLAAAYTRIAAELGAQLLPVGDAFFAADSDSIWGFRGVTGFDPKTAQHPALPDQTHSLHVGWRWSKSKDGRKLTLRMDGHHANLAGEYLGACVWYEVLFGESAVGNSFVPNGLATDHAHFLQETAHLAVQSRQSQPAVGAVR